LKLKRLRYCNEAIFKKIDFTNVGINTDIKDQVGKVVKISKISNLHNSTNNVLVEVDNKNFWVSYKDLEEICIGVTMTYQEIESWFLENTDTERMDVFKKIETIRKKLSLNQVKMIEVSEEVNIPAHILLEIYFLF